MAKKYLCMHSHFYQPPRENPWLEEIETEASAAPFHNWNERICVECYRPHTGARILTVHGRIRKMVNLYTKINFNFGPTLLSWMEKHAPMTYGVILKADQLSQKMYGGHGNAIAQVYNHIIMPLANDEDKKIQVAWGIEDFKMRFKRSPEGMWLAETAVDLQSLEVLSEAGIQFTILSPHQALRIRALDSEEWTRVEGGKINPKQPYRCFLSNGKTIDLFFYDGGLAQSIAFGGVLSDGEIFFRRILEAFVNNPNEDELVHVATDGETYGHHHKFGEMSLAYMFEKVESMGIQITNYAKYLEDHPPTHAVEIIERSAWSCSHGVGRWESDCGCKINQSSNWHQRWRRPLRHGLDFLRDEIKNVCQNEFPKYLKNSDDALKDYIHVFSYRSPDTLERFWKEHALHTLKDEDKSTCLKLLEMRRNALLMYTSCGWFFDDVSGLESKQILKYADRVIELARDFNLDLEESFAKKLEQAESNIPFFKTGRAVYEKDVILHRINLSRLCASYATQLLFPKHRLRILEASCFSYKVLSQQEKNIEESRSIFGSMRLQSFVTQEAQDFYFYSQLIKSDQMSCFIRKHIQDEEQALLTKFSEDQLTEQDFDQSYRLSDLLVDQQNDIYQQILKAPLSSFKKDALQFYKNQKNAIRHQLDEVEYISDDLKWMMGIVYTEEIVRSLQEKLSPRRLAQIVERFTGAKRYGISLSLDQIKKEIKVIVEKFSEEIFIDQSYSDLKGVGELLHLADHEHLRLDLWDIKRECYTRLIQNSNDALIEFAEYLGLDPHAILETAETPNL